MYDFDLSVSWNFFILWQQIPMSPSEEEEYLNYTSFANCFSYSEIFPNLTQAIGVHLPIGMNFFKRVTS